MKKKIIIFTIIGLIILTGSIYAGYKRHIYKEMKAVVEREVIYEGIYIDEKDFGGLSYEEAKKILDEMKKEAYSDRELKIKFEGEIRWMLPYSYFEFTSDMDTLLEEAYKVGKEGTLKERYNIIMQLRDEPIHYEVTETYNESRILDFVQDIEEGLNVEPQDATFERVDGNFVIHDEVIGIKVNLQESVDSINNALLNKENEVDLIYEKTIPEITRAFYEPVKDLIGSFSTSFSANQKERNENLRIACERINGTLLMPGEEFSTNKTIGPVDAANGYLNAPVIVSGKLQLGIGGGVCQIATTLYNAVLMAELEVTQRQNHSLPVGYIEKGKDATLAGDYIDFKFVNSTPNPIYIESYIQNNQIIMNIYGHEVHESNRRIEYSSEIINTIMPPPEQVIVDSSLKPGEEVVEKKATLGYTVKLYKFIYIDDVLQEKVEVNTSVYKSTAGVKRVGPSS